MALFVPIENGKVMDNSASATSSSKNSSKASASSKSGLDKEAFLQLLVTQMQYQDPLEPMDNTEYISQLATFSQLEATQNLSDTVGRDMANGLVGKQVFLNVTDKMGNVSTICGKVDYVKYEKGEAFVSVNGGLYSLSDLSMVTDAEYYEASEMATMFSMIMAKLPDPKYVTASDAKAVADARAVYNSMNSYQRNFVSEENLTKLEELEKKIAVMVPSTGGNSQNGSSDKKDDAQAAGI